MILAELKNIVEVERIKKSQNSYIRNILKEYLQMYVLFFIYTNLRYQKNLIFTGGTCLRHFFNLPRLSEDLDFDYLQKIDSHSFQKDLEAFFTKRYQYREITTALKQQGRQIILKFPVLKKLELAKEKESDMLYVKIDLSSNPSKFYEIEITSKGSFGFNFVARHYDLSTLMAGKIHAILTRRYLKGTNNRESVKGRDYFDLLWFIKKECKPNLKRLNDLLGKNLDWRSLRNELDQKVLEVTTKYKSDFVSDLLPLVLNPEVIPLYVDNYAAEYKRYVK